MDTLGDVFEGAKVVAYSIFAGFVALLILSAGSTEVIVERFARFITAVALTYAPTSPLAIGIAFVSAIIAGMSASKIPGSTLLKLFVAIVVWQLFSLTLNYITAPV